MTIPTDAGFVDGLQIVQMRFDTTQASAGVALDHGNRVVTQNIAAATHKTVLCTEGFSCGKIFTAFRVLDKAVHANIMIGVSDGQASGLLTSGSYYPGYSADKGVSLYGQDGHRYYSNTNASMPDGTFGTGDEIGVLLNMEHNTVTFYKNGKRLGTAAGRDVLTAKKYFFAVSLFELGHSVLCLAPPGAGDAAAAAGPARGGAASSACST